MRGRRYLLVAGCLAVGAWAWGGSWDWGSEEVAFGRLLRRDATLLASEQNPSWWDGLTLPWRRHRLDAAYRRFLRSHPGHARARVAYGSYLFDEDRPADAVVQWEQALAADPRHAPAWNSLGEHYVQSGQIDQGLRCFEKAVEFDPERAWYRFNWANTFSLYRRDTQVLYGWNTTEIMTRALTELRRARQLDPNDRVIARAYAELFYCIAEPNWAEAYEAWRFCLQQQPRDLVERQMIYGKLARLALRLRQFPDADAWLALMTHPQVLSMREALVLKKAALEKGESETLFPFMRAAADR